MPVIWLYRLERESEPVFLTSLVTEDGTAEAGVVVVVDGGVGTRSVDGTSADVTVSSATAAVPSLEPLVWLFVVSIGAGVASGTSRDWRTGLRSEVVAPETLTGNLVLPELPTDRSRRWRGDGAGLVALALLAIARFLSSMFARRLLSSVLIARGREAVLLDLLDSRLSSPKICF